MIQARAYGLFGERQISFFPLYCRRPGKKKQKIVRSFEGGGKYIFWEKTKLGFPASLRAAWDAQPSFWDTKPRQPSRHMAPRVFDHPTSTAGPTTANSELLEIRPNTSQAPVIKAILDSGANSCKFNFLEIHSNTSPDN